MKAVGRKTIGRWRLLLWALLLLCSPVLVPLLCLSLPFLLCALLRPPPLRRRHLGARAAEDGAGKAMLHRYLEDQMDLVAVGVPVAADR